MTSNSLAILRARLRVLDLLWVICKGERAQIVQSNRGEVTARLSKMFSNLMLVVRLFKPRWMLWIRCSIQATSLLGSEISKRASKGTLMTTVTPLSLSQTCLKKRSSLLHLSSSQIWATWSRDLPKRSFLMNLTNHRIPNRKSNKRRKKRGTQKDSSLFQRLNSQSILMIPGLRERKNMWDKRKK